MLIKRIKMEFIIVHFSGFFFSIFISRIFLPTSTMTSERGKFYQLLCYKRVRLSLRNKMIIIKKRIEKGVVFRYCKNMKKLIS